MAKQTLFKGHKLMSIKFQENWNKKLYGKYFTTIRKEDYFVQAGERYDIILKGKGVMIAKCIGCETVLFNNIPEALIVTDTGYSYSESLELFYKFGINVKSFDTKVKIYLFEVESYVNGNT